MSLNEFLGDSTLGSWADEMDTLPTAPAAREDSHPLGRRDDFHSQRSDRHFAPIHEDLPLPTHPPYTAFVGNLAFDITEKDLEDFFQSEIKSVKIIRDREDKPKGFGYVEFTELDSLKDALTRTGVNFSGRTIRVSVAEAPRERPSFLEEDPKFSTSWRREGQRLPAREPLEASASPSDSSQWRSRHSQGVPPVHGKSFTFNGQPERDGAWQRGSKFVPEVEGKASADPSSWRKQHDSTSPNTSTPPTPQLTRKKLELLPRSSANSTTPSPLSSPKMASASARSNPFGAAKPVDVSQKEREIATRLEGSVYTHPMSRSNSKQPMSRTSSKQPVQRDLNTSHAKSGNVRPLVSFASAAGANAPPPSKGDSELESVACDKEEPVEEVSTS